jgi:hypothetical protein
MRRHDLDPWSLVFGVAFLTVAGSYLLSHTTDVKLHWLLVLPASLIVIGVGVLGASVRRIQRADDGGDQMLKSTTTGA